MPKKKPFNLSDKDYSTLKKFVRSGHTNARQFMRAEILLMLHNQLTGGDIYRLFGYAETTTSRVKLNYLAGGIDFAICDAKRSGRPQKITTNERAKITALACAEPPKGHGRWTLSLLKDKSIELKLVKSVSRSQVARILKKTN